MIRLRLDVGGNRSLVRAKRDSAIHSSQLHHNRFVRLGVNGLDAVEVSRWAGLAALHAANHECDDTGIVRKWK
jgi:hypothetical protein